MLACLSFVLRTTGKALLDAVRIYGLGTSSTLVVTFMLVITPIRQFNIVLHRIEILEVVIFK